MNENVFCYEIVKLKKNVKYENVNRKVIICLKGLQIGLKY